MMINSLKTILLIALIVLFIVGTVSLLFVIAEIVQSYIEKKK